MKRLYCILFGVVILLAGCEKENSINSIMAPLRTDDDYSVSLHSVEALFQRTDVNTRGLLSSSASSSILPFTLLDETVFYIVNHPNNQGWQIISSDRRTPPVLAESPRGHFSMETDNPGLLGWMMSVAENMYTIKHAKNADLSFSEEEISANIRFWSKEPSRSLDPHPEDDGAWIGITTTVTEVVDSIPHLTTTQWHQRFPYNKYCPLRTDVTGERAPAGCIAIAGAQMLYFLHEKWGIPQTMVSNALCTGYVGNYYMEQWNATSTVWEDMDPDICVSSSCTDPHPEAVMVACVGTLMEMIYGNDGSHPALSNSDMVEHVFNYFGIDCDYGSYSENDVKSSLNAGIPVIVSAKAQWYPNWQLEIPGHSFLIDGYKRTRIKSTTHYTFVPNDPDNYDPSTHPSYDVITYSNPEITGIKMNWGYWYQWYIDGVNNTDYLNDGWYTLTGDWIVDKCISQSNYQYYRKMLYNFTIL